MNYYYKKALEIDSTYLTSYNNLCSAYLETARGIHEGILYCQKAVKLDPTYFEAHLNLANAFERTGNINNAFKHYLRLVELKPFEMVSFKLFNNFLRRNTRQVEKGIRALDMLANNVETPKLLLLNISGLNSGDPTKEEIAIHYLERAFELDTTDSSLCKKLIQHFSDKGNSEKVTYYRKFLF